MVVFISAIVLGAYGFHMTGEAQDKLSEAMSSWETYQQYTDDDYAHDLYAAWDIQMDAFVLACLGGAAFCVGMWMASIGDHENPSE